MPDQPIGNPNTHNNASTAQQPSPPPRSQHTEYNGHDIGGNDKADKRKVECPTKNQEYWPGRIQAVCTVILVFITGFYTYYAHQQAGAAIKAAIAAKDEVKVASGTLSETQNSNTTQAKLTDAARISSETASQKAIHATQDAMRLDQRAWVAVIDISGVPVVGQQWIVHIRARNTGKTFAKKFKMMATAYKVIPPAVSPDYRQETKPPYTSVSVLAPNGEYTANLIMTGEGSNPFIPNPTQDDLNRIKTQVVKLVVAGRMEYIDIFHKAHWTTFCVGLDTNIEWKSCSAHNDADDN